MTRARLFLLIAAIGLVDIGMSIVFGWRPIPIGTYLVAELAAWAGIEVGERTPR